VVCRPSVDEFDGLFDPLLEIERTALWWNDPAEYSAQIGHEQVVGSNVIGWLNTEIFVYKSR
jgi:hypothetical protein